MLENLLFSTRSQNWQYPRRIFPFALLNQTRLEFTFRMIGLNGFVSCTSRRVRYLGKFELILSACYNRRITFMIVLYDFTLRQQLFWKFMTQLDLFEVLMKGKDWGTISCLTFVQLMAYFMSCVRFFLIWPFLFKIKIYPGGRICPVAQIYNIKHTKVATFSVLQ